MDEEPLAENLSAEEKLFPSAAESLQNNIIIERELSEAERVRSSKPRSSFKEGMLVNVLLNIIMGYLMTVGCGAIHMGGLNPHLWISAFTDMVIPFLICTVLSIYPFVPIANWITEHITAAGGKGTWKLIVFRASMALCMAFIMSIYGGFVAVGPGQPMVEDFLNYFPLNLLLALVLIICIGGPLATALSNHISRALGWRQRPRDVRHAATTRAAAEAAADGGNTQAIAAAADAAGGIAEKAAEKNMPARLGKAITRACAESAFKAASYEELDEEHGRAVGKIVNQAALKAGAHALREGASDKEAGFIAYAAGTVAGQSAAEALIANKSLEDADRIAKIAGKTCAWRLMAGDPEEYAMEKAQQRARQLIAA